jgi:hypothetical protein
LKTNLIIQLDQQGKVIAGRRRLIQALQSLSGQRVLLTIEKYKRKRTSSQNRYLHGVVFPMLQQRLLDLGWKEAVSIEWVKDLIKYHFLKMETVNEKTGEVITSIRATSSLTTSEMMDFIADIQQWSAETLGLYIPDPNEQIELI